MCRLGVVYYDKTRVQGCEVSRQSVTVSQKVNAGSFLIPLSVKI